MKNCVRCLTGRPLLAYTSPWPIRLSIGQIDLPDTAATENTYDRPLDPTRLDAAFPFTQPCRQLSLSVPIRLRESGLD
jgi:hypothetical protein